MLADAARVEQEPEQTDGNKDGGKPPVQLKTKDDIKNYLKGIISVSYTHLRAHETEA